MSVVHVTRFQSHSVSSTIWLITHNHMTILSGHMTSGERAGGGGGEEVL